MGNGGFFVIQKRERERERERADLHPTHTHTQTFLSIHSGNNFVLFVSNHTKPSLLGKLLVGDVWGEEGIFDCFS